MLAQTIRVSLRYYQQQGQGEPANRSSWTQDLASDLGQVSPLYVREIDELCQRINIDHEEDP